MNYTKKQNGWINTNNIWGFLLGKYALAVLLLLLSQIYFCCWNTRLFHVETAGEWLSIAWGNLVVGLATVGFALLPYFAAYLLPMKCRHNKHYKRIIEGLFYIIPMLFITIANCCDTAYFQFTYRRLTGEIFQYLGIGGNMQVLIPRFIVDYWYAGVGVAALVFLTFFFSSRVKLSDRRQFGNIRANNCVGLLLALACLGLLSFGLTTHKGLNTTRYCQGQNSALVTNSGYNILHTLLDGGKLPDEEYMAEAEARRLFDPAFAADTLSGASEAWVGWAAGAGQWLAAADSTGLNRQLRHSNVVVIVLESFSQEFMGCYNPQAEVSYTPFLDSLSQHCVVYQGRSNGKKSIEGIPAIFGSLPTLMAYPLTLTDYDDDSLNALPAVLARNGYRTAFFHGSYNGVMQFDEMCRKLGFGEYYGKNEYMTDRLSKESDFDGCWGIFDEPYLQYMSRRLTTFKEPFFAGVFTLSSHHPYTMDPCHANDFQKGPHPINRVMMYTDNALRKFFDSARQTPWYYNTTFIITADHPGPGLTPAYNGYTGWYRIPMLVYRPLYEEKLAPAYGPEYSCHMVSDRIMQQTDIMPTLLDYLGIQAGSACFGTSVFRNPDNGWQIAFGNNYYQLETKDGVAVLKQGKEEVHGNGNIQLLKAVVQQYNARLIKNQLTK